MSPLIFFVLHSFLFTVCVCHCQNGWITYNDTCYLIGYDHSLTFIDAEHYCSQHNGHLIHVNSAEENQFIVDFLHKTKAPTCWIGLSDIDVEGQWEWYGTNETPEFTYWFHTQPGGHQAENCAVYTTRHPDYQWDDFSCDHHFHPICETSTDDGGPIIG